MTRRDFLGILGIGPVVVAAERLLPAAPAAAEPPAAEPTAPAVPAVPDTSAKSIAQLRMETLMCVTMCTFNAGIHCAHDYFATTIK